MFHYREVCDPVQSETYLIDGITVSNFVLPHYYNSMGESGGRNDFLGTGLQAFRWNENGVIGFWDPRQGARGKLRHLATVRPEPPGRQALIA